MHAVLKKHLIHQTSPVYTVLWSMFIYWFFVMVTHSVWSCGGCITKSLGVSAIVGCGLNTNAYAGSSADSILGFLKMSPFSVMRFFLIPFCVASYSAIVNVKKENFTYLFPNDGPDNFTYSGIVAVMIVVFICISQLIHRTLREDPPAEESPSTTNEVSAPTSPDPALGGERDLKLETIVTVQ